MILITSNKNKLNELIRLGLPISETKKIDLPEVLSDPTTVALYKSIEAGSNSLIEDTILKIDDEYIVDIRWRINEIIGLSEKTTINWVVTLAHNDGYKVNIYTGEIPCKINPRCLMFDFKKSDDSFGFDEYLIPQMNDNKGHENKLSLYELEKKGCKDCFSARKIAVDNFISGKKTTSVLVSDLLPWKGKFQKG